VTHNVGIDETIRGAVVTGLFPVLGQLWKLYTQTLVFHWNVEGCGFFELHAAFGEQYEKLLKGADRLAERIRALGETISFEGVEPVPPITDPEKMVQILYDGHEEAARGIRELLDSLGGDRPGRDHATENLLAEFLDCHEKLAWMLGAYLEAKPGGLTPPPGPA
jgi:starvation-inducible DNA-binding protein